MRVASTDQRFKYNGKELDESTNWYDYQLRQYDPELGVWHAIDPSAESYYSWSPYNYVFNNPIMFIDPDGADPENPLAGIVQGVVDAYNFLTNSDISYKQKLETTTAVVMPTDAINVAGKLMTGDYENISQDEALSATKQVAGLALTVATAGEGKMATISDDLANASKVTSKVDDVASGAADEVVNTSRPSNFRKQTVSDSWDNAADGSAANTKACPTCGKDVKGNPNLGEGRNTADGWDVSHNPSWSRRDLSGASSRKEVLDNYNSGTGLECRSCNRGRGNKDERRTNFRGQPRKSG